MSEPSEPTFLVLDENEDFSMEAHVDSDGYQRVAVTGYLQKTKPDGIYQAPLLPDMFFGVDGQQLQGSWRQYLTAGDHVILSRDSGNPRVSDIVWSKVSSTPQRPSRQASPTHVRTAEIPYTLIYILIGVPVGLYIIYKILEESK